LSFRADDLEPLSRQLLARVGFSSRVPQRVRETALVAAMQQSLIVGQVRSQGLGFRKQVESK